MCATADSQATVACNAAVAHKVRSYRGKVHPGPVHDSGVGAMSLYAELKRRNVFRVAAAYLVLGWLFLQIASVVLQFIGAPDWVGKAIIALLVIGFIPSLAVAWVFEVGPAGVQRDDGTQHGASGHRGRRLDILTLIGVVVVALIAFAEQLRVPEKPDAVPTAVPAAATPAVASASQGDAARASSAPLPPFDPPRASIAVLPFSNMSPDPENEYFADGISEELLNVLSAVDGLKVASRTSAFAFKGGKQSVGEIARSLDVAHVLEGSVRKQGARVRITAQLIDASSDQHLWSDTYDRELTDIFAVQEEIAKAIAGELGDALGIDAAAKGVRVEKPTEDFAAYEDFLRGRQLFHQRGEGLLTARALLEKVVERDPAFAEAWAVLAGVYIVSPSYVSLSEAEGYALGEPAAQRARQLDDRLALPHAVLGLHAADAGRLLQARELFDHAIERETNDSTARIWRGMFGISIGDLAAAEADFRRGLEMDPLSPINNGWLGQVRALRGDRTEGDARLARALELGWVAAPWLQSAWTLADGDRELAARQFEQFSIRFRDLDPATANAIEHYVAAIRDPSRGPELVAAVKASPGAFAGTAWSSWLTLLGMDDDAMAIAAEQGRLDYDTLRMVWAPTARSVLANPKFLELAKPSGLIDYWDAKGYPEGCRVVETPERHLDCTERWR